MCFFRNKNGKHPKKGRNANKKIVCPHCFGEPFADDEVVFIDSSNNNKYIPKEGKGRIVYSEFVGANKKVNKVVSGFIPTGKSASSELRERFCPHCGKRLPIDLGLCESSVISVIGSTQIGKTVYIISLLDQLEKNLSNKFPNIAFTIENEKMIHEFQAMRTDIINGTLEPTPPGQEKYFIISIKNTVTNELTILSFYDFAGEATVEDIKKNTAKQIAHADAMLILFDFTQMNTLFPAVMRKNIKEQENKREQLIKKIGIYSENDLLILTKLCDTDALLNPEFIKKQIADAKGKLQSAQIAKERAESDIEIRKHDNAIRNYSSQIQNLEISLKKITNQKLELESKIKQIPDIEETLEENPQKLEEIISLIKQLNKIDKKIFRLKEDAKNYGSHYNEETDRYDPHFLPTHWINVAINNGLSMSGLQKFDIPVAIVGTKSDEILEAINNDCMEINDSEKLIYDSIAKQLSAEPNPTSQKNYVNLTAVDSISGFVENQLLKDDNNLKTTLNGFFSDMTYFAVSALGCKYVYEEKIDDNGIVKLIKSLENDKLNPWRVDEPLLWLLYKLGKISGQHLD